MAENDNFEALSKRIDKIDGFLKSIADRVQTKSLQLFDDQGKCRGRFGTAKDGEPRLEMFGADGKTRIFIGFNNGEPYVGLNDNDGNPCIRLSTSSAHWKGLHISDQSDGKGSVARVGIGPTGRSLVVLAGRERQIQAVLQVDVDASLELCDSNQKTIFRAPVKPE